jgi:hypothetical protein
MRRLSIELKRDVTETSWYFFSCEDKELQIRIKKEIPGLTLILRGTEGFGDRLRVIKNVPVIKQLEHYSGYFAFKYLPLRNDTEIDVDILTNTHDKD